MSSTLVSDIGAPPRSISRLPSLVLAIWTVIVWGGRIRNVIADDELTGFGTTWRLALAGSFLVGAAVVLVALAIDRRWRSAGVALAWWGIVVWTIRGTQIALGDHPVGFIAVHTVLALVTIALSIVVVGFPAILARRWVNQ